MVRWFRHYPGLARDGKLVAVALRSGQPIERVVWTWCAILEDAAERLDNGGFEIDTLEAAHFLGCAAADLDAILAALEANGRIANGAVCAWDARQYLADKSTPRTRAWRDRKRAGTSPGTIGNVPKPSPGTIGNGPESESESESDSYDAESRYAARGREQKRTKGNV